MGRSWLHQFGALKRKFYLLGGVSTQQFRPAAGALVAGALLTKTVMDVFCRGGKVSSCPPQLRTLVKIKYPTMRVPLRRASKAREGRILLQYSTDEQRRWRGRDCSGQSLGISAILGGRCSGARMGSLF
jgi:hypothetical protein